MVGIRPSLTIHSLCFPLLLSKHFIFRSPYSFYAGTIKPLFSMRTTLPSCPRKSHDPLPPLRDDAFFALLEGGFGRKRCDCRTEKKRRVETERHKKDVLGRMVICFPSSNGKQIKVFDDKLMYLKATLDGALLLA